MKHGWDTDSTARLNPSNPFRPCPSVFHFFSGIFRANRRLPYNGVLNRLFHRTLWAAAAATR